MRTFLEDTVFNPDTAFNDTDGLGTTTEDAVVDPEDISTKTGPAPTTKMENSTEGVGQTTSNSIFNPDDVDMRDEDKGIKAADKVSDKADDYREKQGEQSFDKISEDCPAKLKGLIPGYESFMQDDKTDIKEEKTDADNAKEEEDTAEAEDEANEAAQDVEDDVKKADMLFDLYDTYAVMYNHAARFGVDRSFLSLMNRNNELGQQLKIAFPATESFTTIGDPNSQITIACLEGLGDALRSIGGFFASLGQKTVILMQRLSEAIQNRFRSLESNIQRVRERIAKLNDDEVRVSKTGAKVISVGSLQQLKQSIHANYAGILEKTVDTLPRILSTIETRDPDQVQNQIAGLEEPLNQLLGQRDIFKQAKKNIEKVPVGQLSRADAIRLLDLAESMKMEINQANIIVKKMKEVASKFKKDAKILGDKPAGKRVAKLLNKTRSAVTKLLKGDLWVAKQCVRAAALRVRIGSSKAGGQVNNFDVNDEYGMENFKESINTMASTEVALEGFFR